jgi:hypothetical protein
MFVFLKIGPPVRRPFEEVVTELFLALFLYEEIVDEEPY